MCPTPSLRRQVVSVSASRSRIWAIGPHGGRARGPRGNGRMTRPRIEGGADGADQARECPSPPPRCSRRRRAGFLELHRRLMAQGPASCNVLHVERCRPAASIRPIAPPHLLLHGQRHAIAARSGSLDVGTHVRSKESRGSRQHIVGHYGPGAPRRRPDPAPRCRWGCRIGPRGAGLACRLTRSPRALSGWSGRGERGSPPARRQVALRVHHSLGHPDRMERLREGLAPAPRVEALPRLRSGLSRRGGRSRAPNAADLIRLPGRVFLGKAQSSSE